MPSQSPLPRRGRGRQAPPGAANRHGSLAFIVFGARHPGGYPRVVSGERALPEQASLRYLKVEAKRRRAAGEFPTLHDAQRAIAREHGQPSWAALRDAVAAADAAAGSEGHALAQLRWIAARFGGAGEPGWLAPGEDELREHFTGEFLAAIPPDRLVARITEVAAETARRPGHDRRDAVHGAGTVRRAPGHGGDRDPPALPAHRAQAAPPRRADQRPAHRRAAHRNRPARSPARCPRWPPTRPARLGLVGLALAGASARGKTRGRPRPDGPALSGPSRSAPATCSPPTRSRWRSRRSAVLCLAADRAPAPRRPGQLLPHRGQARRRRGHRQGPAHAHRRGDRPGAGSARRPSPRLRSVTGPVVACTGKRGTFGPQPRRVRGARRDHRGAHRAHLPGGGHPAWCCAPWACTSPGSPRAGRPGSRAGGSGLSARDRLRRGGR